MSYNCIQQPNAKFGFQILYRGINAKKSKLEIGKEPHFPIELEINLNLTGRPTGMAKVTAIADSFTFRPSLNENRHIDSIDIPANTLLIRYSRDLFTLSSLKKSFDLRPTLLEQFIEDSYRILN